MAAFSCGPLREALRKCRCPLYCQDRVAHRRRSEKRKNRSSCVLREREEEKEAEEEEEEEVKTLEADKDEELIFFLCLAAAARKPIFFVLTLRKLACLKNWRVVAVVSLRPQRSNGMPCNFLRRSLIFSKFFARCSSSVALSSKTAESS